MHNVTIILPNNEEVDVPVTSKTRVSEIFSRIVDKLGIREPQFFALGQLSHDRRTVLPVLDSHRAVKYPLLHFTVQCYAEHYMLLHDKTTRLMYYQQMRQNIRLLPVNAILEEECFTLVSYALQVEFGDYDPERHPTLYFNPKIYFPLWVVENRGIQFIAQAMPSLHRDLASLSRNEAVKHFLKRCADLPELNMHRCYFLSPKSDIVEIGLTANALSITSSREQLRYPWGQVGQLTSKKRKFCITPLGVTSSAGIIEVFAHSEVESKLVLNLARKCHSWHIKTAALTEQLKKLDEHLLTTKKYRESYIGGGETVVKSPDSSLISEVPENHNNISQNSTFDPSTASVLDRSSSLSNESNCSSSLGFPQKRDSGFDSWNPTQYHKNLIKKHSGLALHKHQTFENLSALTDCNFSTLSNSFIQQQSNSDSCINKSPQTCTNHVPTAVSLPSIFAENLVN